MSRREKGKKQRSKRHSEFTDFSFSNGEINLAAEKQKARDLRSSSWWKKKISSGKCYYCQEIFHISELTMDHLIPLARGGKSEKINLVPACKECNNKKKHLLPIEWDEHMQRIKNS